MIRFFEQRSGIPYPLPRYTQVILDKAPPQEIAGGAFLSTSYISSFLAYLAEDDLLAHELAPSVVEKSSPPPQTRRTSGCTRDSRRS